MNYPNTSSNLQPSKFAHGTKRSKHVPELIGVLLIALATAVALTITPKQAYRFDSNKVSGQCCQITIKAKPDVEFIIDGVTYFTPVTLHLPFGLYQTTLFMAGYIPRDVMMMVTETPQTLYFTLEHDLHWQDLISLGAAGSLFNVEFYSTINGNFNASLLVQRYTNGVTDQQYIYNRETQTVSSSNIPVYNPDAVRLNALGIEIGFDPSYRFDIAYASISPSGNYAIVPRYSPDATSKESAELWLINLKDHTERIIAHNMFVPSSATSRQVLWSPDSQNALIFSSSAGFSPGTIDTVQIFDGSSPTIQVRDILAEIHQAAPNANDVSFVSASPDLKRILLDLTYSIIDSKNAVFDIKSQKLDVFSFDSIKLDGSAWHNNQELVMLTSDEGLFEVEFPSFRITRKILPLTIGAPTISVYFAPNLSYVIAWRAYDGNHNTVGVYDLSDLYPPSK